MTNTRVFLVVSESLRKSLQKLLRETWGCEVTLALSNPDAKNNFTPNHFGLVILDPSMSQESLSTAELASIIKDAEPSQQIVCIEPHRFTEKPDYADATIPATEQTVIVGRMIVITGWQPI